MMNKPEVGQLTKKRLSERLAVAIFVAGVSFAAQAEHCVQGTLCYPDPADACGPTGPVWCGTGDDNGIPQQPFTIQIPHMRDNPYPVTCGVSDRAQMLQSAGFDLLSFARSNGYQNLYGSPPLQLTLDEMEFDVHYSDGSYVVFTGGGVAGPGQYDPAILSTPLGPYHIVGNGFYATVPFATATFGPDAAGYVFQTNHAGYVDYRAPNVSPPPLCLPPI